MNVESKDDKILKNIILNAIEKIELIDLFMTSKYISSYLLLVWMLIIFLLTLSFLNLEKYKKIKDVRYKEKIDIKIINKVSPMIVTDNKKKLDLILPVRLVA